MTAINKGPVAQLLILDPTVQVCAIVIPNSFRHLLAKHLLRIPGDSEIILNQVQDRVTFCFAVDAVVTINLRLVKAQYIIRTYKSAMQQVMP